MTISTRVTGPGNQAATAGSPGEADDREPGEESREQKLKEGDSWPTNKS